MIENTELNNTWQYFELSELIIENNPSGIILIDNNFNIRRFNKKAENSFGYLSEEVINKHLSTIVSLDFLEIYAQNSNTFSLDIKKKAVPLEIHGKRKDGQAIILEVITSEFKYKEECFYLINFNDITKKKLYDELLREVNKNLEKQIIRKSSELSSLAVSLQEEISRRQEKEQEADNLFTAIEQTEESIIILSKTGIIDYVNPVFTTITGFSIKDVYQKRAKLLIGPTKVAEYKQIARTLIAGEKWQGLYSARRKDGSFYEEEAIIIPIKKDKKEIISYVAVCRDVSEKRRVESLITNVDMMKNVGYIFAGIRHELGNPINSIKMSLSVLKKGLDTYSSETAMIYVERSLSEVSRVEYLLKNLKSFSMYENLKLEKVNLLVFMEKFCALAREDAKKQGINLSLKCSNPEIYVLIDQRAFHQIMLNIFSNSVDALQKREHPQISISLTTENKQVRIEIEDNGIGLTDSQREKLFKPFHTFKTQGTGLGLVITKKLITSMKGLIRLESKYQVGTKVSILLELVS